MTLYQIVSYLKQIALSSPYIRTAEEGSVYTIMNGNPHSKYSVFVVSQTQHRQDEIFDYYGLNLFVIDRLVDDLESNRLQTQSLAKEVLTNTILTLESKFYGITHNELQFHPFTEKFVDLTAGQYVQVTFQVPRNLICPDDYGLDFPSNYKLLPLNVEITDNGVYEYSPVADFDGYDSVTLTINVPQTGYTQEDLDNAYASGETHQKSLLQDIEITHNGEYQVENGFDKVIVNTDSGQTIYNQTKSVEYSGNGEYTLTYDDGYTGLEAVNININVPQTGYTQEDLDNAYESGITSGETYQKSLLEDIEITHNGEYTSINGYSAITVNVPQSGYTEQDLIDAFNSGITYQKSLLSGVTITTNGTYIYPNGISALTVNVSGDTPTPPESAYTNMYLTFEIISGGNITWTTTSGWYANLIQYSTDNGETWTSIRASAAGTEIPVSVGDKVLFKGNRKSYASESYTSSFAYSTCKFKVYGNIMSLTDGDDFVGQTTIPSGYCFNEIFGCFGADEESNCLIDAENLVLPATTLANNCYSNMFNNCKSLISAPSLSSITTFAPWSCQYMFRNCTSLRQVPSTIGTSYSVMARDCCNTMFYGCTSMTVAPELPAPTLAEYCYAGMFQNCTNLNYIKCLATDISASNCTAIWLLSASASGTFVKKSGVEWPRNDGGIPNGWTVIEV